MNNTNKLKTTKNGNTAIAGDIAAWGYAYVIAEHIPNALIGNILTLLELLGLPEKQEQPLKDLVRQKVWDIINNGAITLTSETHTELRNKHYQVNKESDGMSHPRMAV